LPLKSHEIPEVAYLGNGQTLSLSGLQMPNARVMSLLRDGDLLKKMFLFFDGLTVFGVGLSKGGKGLSPQPPRPLHELSEGEYLFADTSTQVDEITIQLIEMGLLTCVDPRGLIPDAEVEKLLETLIDFATRSGPGSVPEEEMVPFDSGALGVLMSDELVKWVVEELRDAGRARIHEAKDLITFKGKHGKSKISIGAELVFVDRGLSEAFAVVSDQVVRAVAWESKVACSPLRASLADGEALSWRIADLAVLESEVAGVDLRGVSLDDIVGFAQENKRLRRAYVRNLRQRAAYLESLEAAEAAVAVQEIQEEIREAGMDFSQYARNYFGPGPVGVALGIAGSVGNMLVGNLPGAALSLAQSLNSARALDAGPIAYSYLFQTRRRLW
jgi:hypothetical protein